MAKKVLFVTLLLAFAIVSADFGVNVSAQQVLGDMADKTKNAAGQTADTSLSWTAWAKKQFQGAIGQNQDDSSSSPSASPAPSPSFSAIPSAGAGAGVGAAAGAGAGAAPGAPNAGA